VEALRGDAPESYVDDYTDEVAEPPGEVTPEQPDDESPTGTEGRSEAPGEQASDGVASADS
jgi:hypothetical protein